MDIFHEFSWTFFVKHCPFSGQGVWGEAPARLSNTVQCQVRLGYVWVMFGLCLGYVWVLFGLCLGYVRFGLG